MKALLEPNATVLAVGVAVAVLAFTENDLDCALTLFSVNASIRSVPIRKKKKCC